MKTWRHFASAAAALSAACFLGGPAAATIEIGGKQVKVVDLHLHPGHFGQIPEGGKQFTIGSTPDFTRLYSSAIFERLLDPYVPHVGIKAQTDAAGVDHAVLYAVYTHKTTGYFTNEQLLSALLDERNTSATPGVPWAFGFASINFFDGFLDPGKEQARLDALSSYLEKYPGRIIGIKLAHAHQAVAFDDAAYLGVYDIAAKHTVPVLLHTGFSPFPGSQTEPEYYDPIFLEQTLTNYDGTGAMGLVNFVMSHVGQGDARAVDHILDLAAAHPNVYLEISALNRPFLIDKDGNPVESSEPQYPYVLQQIKAKGLTDRAIFGTDGPQFSGFVEKYLGILVQGMKDAGYTDAEMEAVLSGNFFKVFPVQP